MHGHSEFNNLIMNLLIFIIKLIIDLFAPDRNSLFCIGEGIRRAHNTLYSSMGKIHGHACEHQCKQLLILLFHKLKKKEIKIKKDPSKWAVPIYD